MRDILADLDRWRRAREDVALATVVGTRGRTPRPLGSHLGASRDGRITGSVSGGCVEGDVVERAIAVLDGGSANVASYTVADEPELGLGLSCGGGIDVLVERLPDEPTWLAIRDAIAGDEQAAWAVAVAPGELVGARLALVGLDRIHGSIHPELDARVGEALRTLVRDETAARTISLPLGDETAGVFLEAFAPRARLVVIGATHVASALCRLAEVVGFHVTVIDPRARYATPERFPTADHVARAWPHEALDPIRLDARSYVVTLTHDAKIDVPALARALKSGARYVGALGSRRTHERRKSELREQGFSDVDLDRIHAPVGLDLGGNSAEEIALAIIAEMVAVRHGRDGSALAGRDGAIHG